MLAEPQPTPADLHFDLAGIPVRVSPWFWLGSALFGWQGCKGLSLAFFDGDPRAMLQLLVIWIGVVFVSLIVHEFGHALAFRTFGQPAHVVLYHFGGLAIPDAWGRRHLRPLQRLLVSAAGPLAQLVVAALIVAGLKLGGWLVPFPIEAVGRPLGLYEGRPFASPHLAVFFVFLLEVNVFWPLLNLAPVPPLDGGQIVREGLLAADVHGAPRVSGVIGVAAGAAVAWWGFTNGQEFLGIMFAMLAVSCFQNLSGPTPWRRWN
ncbi:MAG: metalloprotease [Planctomycetaceae bacterium]